MTTSDRSTSGSTSRSLLAGVRARDAAAWDRLVDLYAPLVRAWCRRARLGEQDAADVVQEVFQTVAERIDAFRRDRRGDSFRGWLRAITRSRIVDHLRRGDREPRGAGGSSVMQRWNELPGAAEGESARRAVDPAVRALLERALARIRPSFRPRTWRAFWACAVEGRPHRDVAEELGVSPGAVRVAKCRVLQRLRAELGETTDAPG